MAQEFASKYLIAKYEKRAPYQQGKTMRTGQLIGEIRAVVVHNAVRRIRLLLVAANRLVDLITMHRYFLRSFHSEAYLVAADFYHDDRNIIIDNDALVLFP